MKSPVNLFKQLVFTPAYNHLYPLSQKEGIVDKINNYDYNNNDTFSKDINSLYLYLLSDIASNNIDIQRTERNLNRTYKTKKVRYKDKETKMKTVEKVQIERKRPIDQEDRERYLKIRKEIESESSRSETLVDRLTAGSITDSDIPVLDIVLKRNRIRTSTYLAIIAAVIIAIVLIIIF